jgi:hypothetical protein
VLDVDMASKEEGAPVVVWKEQFMNLKGNQKWIIQGE